MTDSRFEELLAEAIQEYGGEYIEVPEEMWKPHRFSRTFEKRMRRILRKERGIHPPRKRIPLRMLIAVIVTAIIAVSLAALTAGALREAFMGFLMNKNKIFANVRVEPDEEAPETLEDIYEVTWVPEGFKLVLDERVDVEHEMLFRKDKDDKDYIAFEQSTISAYRVNYNNENVEYKPIKVNSCDGFWITGDDTCIFVWKNDDYVFEIVTTLDITPQNEQDVIFKIAESVQKVED